MDNLVGRHGLPKRDGAQLRKSVVSNAATPLTRWPSRNVRLRRLRLPGSLQPTILFYISSFVEVKSERNEGRGKAVMTSETKRITHFLCCCVIVVSLLADQATIGQQRSTPRI